MSKNQQLTALSFTATEAKQLRRISKDLHSWHEKVCGTYTGCIERDEESGQPFWRSVTGELSPLPDREASAKKRLDAIMAGHPELSAYIQTDPRGVALYILRPGDVPPGGDARAYYTRGIAVY